MYPNIGFVAAAGSGKSTCARYLSESCGYRVHALATPLKVTAAFNIVRQFRLPLLDRPYTDWTAHVDRIIHGEMGVMRGAEFERELNRQIKERWGTVRPDPLLLKNVYTEEGEEIGIDHDRYAEDIAVRDALLTIERRYKPFLRGEEQQYGTEVIRKIAESLRPGTWQTPEEEWTTILARAGKRDNRQGFPVACDDVRHHHEAATIVQRLEGRGLLIRIERSERAAEGMTAERATHSSEAEWMHIPTHYRIVNDGPLEDLHRALSVILADVDESLYGDFRSLDWPVPIYDANGVTAFRSA